MKMSTIYLLHILVCSDSEQSVLIPACHSLGGACRAVCFRSRGQKKKGADTLTIQILASAWRATHAPRPHAYLSSVLRELLSLLMLRCPAVIFLFKLLILDVFPFYFFVCLH